MRFTSCVLIALLLATPGCTASATGPDADESLIVSSGTSFGFCTGYCFTELVLEPSSARLTERSRDEARYPTKARSRALTADEWSRIQRLADPAVLATVGGVHGCPDCADGGAEWIEVRTSQDSIRATFEYGHVLSPIAALQVEVRALREQLR